MVGKRYVGKAMLAKKILVEQSQWVNPYSGWKIWWVNMYLGEHVWGWTCMWVKAIWVNNYCGWKIWWVNNYSEWKICWVNNNSGWTCIWVNCTWVKAMWVKAMLAKNNGGWTWMWFKALWLNVTVGETPWNHFYLDQVVLTFDASKFCRLGFCRHQGMWGQAFVS